MRVKHYFKLETWLSILYSVYFNFRYLPFPLARKLPFLINYKTKVVIGKKARIEVPQVNKCFTIKLGYNSREYVPNNKSNYFRIEGVAIFGYNIEIFRGFNISTFGEKSRLLIGNNFLANNNFYLTTKTKIEIGEDVLVGWNSSIRNFGIHKINGIVKNDEIIIGNHIWLAAFVDILEGVNLKRNTVVATHSLVTSKINSIHKRSSLIGGTPAKVLKENINWEL